MTQYQGPGWEQRPDQPPQWAPPPPPQWAPPPPPAGPPGQPTKSCPACGSAIDSRAIDCPRCGVRQPDVGYQEPKSRPIAILLALLLGAFGVHRFYLGPTTWGVLYLLFFWTGIPGLLAWFEAIWFLTRSDEEWAHTYGGPVLRSNGAAIGCLWLIALWPIVFLVLGILSLSGVIFVGGQIESILSEIEAQLTFAPRP